MDTGTPNDAAAASVPTPPAPAPSWPMSVDEFLAGPYLARSDVVLTRKQRDFRSWLIRLATRGSFSHAALVFLVPHQEKGFNNSFVIESASGGVDLSNLADYLKDKRSIVGIKRIRGAATWFDQETAALVRGRMLNSIQAEYAYATAFRIALDFINQIAFGMKAFISGHRRAIAGREAANLSAPNAFICSGLVQLGFVNGVVELIETGKLLPSAVSDVVFREDLAHFLPEDWEAFTDAEQLEIMWDFARGFQTELLAATPEHLAESDRLDWVYIVRDQKVFPVSSDAEARKMLRWTPKTSGARV